MVHQLLKVCLYPTSLTTVCELHGLSAGKLEYLYGTVILELYALTELLSFVNTHPQKNQINIRSHEDISF